MGISPIELQNALSGANYPASKDELIVCAEANGAPTEVFDALKTINDDRYASPAAVSAALTE